MDNKISQILQQKLAQTKIYLRDEKKEFTQLSKTDEMTIFSLNTNPDGIVTVKTVIKVNIPFEKVVSALNDIQYLKNQTPNLEDWIVAEKNDSYLIHHYKTSAKTDIIFGEVKEHSENLSIFAGASVDFPSITLGEGRTLTLQNLNSTIVSKLSQDQTEITYIMYQNITRYDAQMNNKILLEVIPPYLLTLSKGYAQYPN